MIKVVGLWFAVAAVAMAFGGGTAFAEEVDARVVGIWRTTDLRKGSLAKEGYLILRADKTGGAFGVTADGEELLAYEFTFEPVGDDIHLKSRWTNRKGVRKDYKVSADERFHFDRSADVFEAKAPFGVMHYRRAPATVKDPYRHNKTASRKELLTGFWRGGSEFNSYSVALSPNGEALLTFAVGGSIGTWEVNTEGNAELRMRDQETGKETVFTALYDAQGDTLRIGDNVPIARNLKVKPEDAIGAIKAASEERLRNEKERRDRWNQQFEKQESTRRFASLSEVLAWVESGKDVYSRSVSFPADANGLSDRISNIRDGASSVRCYLSYGLAEEGNRPNGSILEKIAWRQHKRPKDMPPNSVTNDVGLAEVKSRISGQKRIWSSDISLVRLYPTGRMCRDELLVEWKAGNRNADEAARILQPRFEKRFPCDLKVSTVRRRAQQRQPPQK